MTGVFVCVILGKKTVISAQSTCNKFSSFAKFFTLEACLFSVNLAPPLFKTIARFV